MKITALVTIVAKDVNGKTVTLEPRKNATGDIQQDVAERLIADGFAEKAKKKDEITASSAPFGGARKRKPSASQVVKTAAEKSGKGDEGEETKKDKRRRSRKELLGEGAGRNPDLNVGEDGRRNDGTDEDED